LSLGKPQHRPEGAAIVEAVSDAHSNSSDSNTFYEEDFSSSEDGSNDGKAPCQVWSFCFDGVLVCDLSVLLLAYLVRE
jgi:hypothetical protein